MRRVYYGFSGKKDCSFVNFPCFSDFRLAVSMIYVMMVQEPEGYL